jgi:hypothetical protein
MKNILLFTLITYGSSVSSSELNFDQIKNVQDFEGVFLISNTTGTKEYAKLDCQSYFHKFDVYNAKDQVSHENFISFGECEYIYKSFQSCIKKEGIKCLDTDDIFNQDCKCSD